MNKTLVARHHLAAAHPAGTGKPTSHCRCSRQKGTMWWKGLSKLTLSGGCSSTPTAYLHAKNIINKAPLHVLQRTCNYSPYGRTYYLSCHSTNAICNYSLGTALVASSHQQLQEGASLLLIHPKQCALPPLHGASSSLSNNIKTKSSSANNGVTIANNGVTCQCTDSRVTLTGGAVMHMPAWPGQKAQHHSASLMLARSPV
jgi:hypothetical protein